MKRGGRLRDDYASLAKDALCLVDGVISVSMHFVALGRLRLAKNARGVPHRYSADAWEVPLVVVHHG